jgi:dTMP kinase
VIVAFEGIDGSGKSTAALDLSAKLKKRGIENVIVGSASLAEDEDDAAGDDAAGIGRPDEDAVREMWRLRDEIAIGFGPRALCLSNAWEFAYRWESLAMPALDAGTVVIADRFTDTPLVREVLRGVDEDYVRRLYSFAPAPDLVVYVDLEPEIAYQRKTRARLPIGYFEAGRDVIRGARGLRTSFVAFQSKCRQRYEAILKRDGVFRVDGTQKPADLHAEVEKLVLGRIGSGGAGRRRTRKPAR